MQRQRNPTTLERIADGIDKAISVFAPAWAARRAMNRLNLRMTAAYESVPTWRNSADWLPVDGSIRSAAGNPIIGGIEVNEYGRPLNYFLEKATVDITAAPEVVKVPADRVFYLADRTRPSEVREITPLVRALDEIRDLEEFFNAVSFKQKINAAVAVFITTQKDAVASIGRSVLQQQQAQESKPSQRIDAGSIKYLDPGQDVKTLVPAGQSSELADFNLSINRRIGAGHNLSYEMMTRDVSMVNYSSARQNLLEDWKVFEGEQQFIVEHFLDFVLEDVVTAAYLAGLVAKGDISVEKIRQCYQARQAHVSKGNSKRHIWRTNQYLRALLKGADHENLRTTNNQPGRRKG